MNDPLSNQVNQDEVHDLLNNLSTEEPRFQKNFDLKPDEHEKLKEALGNADIRGPKDDSDQENKSPKINTPIAQPFTPESENLNDFLSWTFKSATVPDTTVTEYEKTIFFKALLNDTEFELDIEFDLFEKYVVSVRGLTSFEQKIIAAALKYDSDEKLIDGLHGFTAFMQQYCLLYQIQTINDKPFNRIEVDKFSSWSYKQHVDHLRQQMREVIDKMPSFKLITLIKAVIIFEIKQKLLHDGLVNRNFWKPQGTV